MIKGFKMAGAILLAVMTCVMACKEEKKLKKKGTIIPIISLLNQQIAHVDTSLYVIMKIVSLDSSRNDTTYIERSKFREVAHEFLSLPDIASAEYNERYKEEETQYDETLGRVILAYSAIKPEDEQIQRQQLLVKSDPPNDKVTTIIVQTARITKDSLVEQTLLWNMDESFQVTTKKQLPAHPEITSTYRVIWNEREY